MFTREVENRKVRRLERKENLHRRMIQNRSGTRRLEICTSMNIKDYKLYEYKLRFRRINKEREREREKNK